MSTSTDTGVTQEFWGDAARGVRKSDYPVHWLESPLVLRHCVNPKISGDPDMGWMEWLRHKFVPEPARAGLVLGCGGGNLERKAASLGLCRNFLGIDISPQAIEVARALAEREGFPEFRYEAADANYAILERDSLDLILADMSLHHIARLEHLLTEFAGALRRGGLLVLNEFVGPSRFQWTDPQLRVATAAIRSLPLRLRRNRNFVKWKRIAKPWVCKAKRWSPGRVARMDPSESVRSEEIPALVEARFDMVQRADYGGGLLALVLNNIVGNFRDCPEHIAILKSLAEQEHTLTGNGTLANNYTFMVCKSKMPLNHPESADLPGTRASGVRPQATT